MSREKAIDLPYIFPIALYLKSVERDTERPVRGGKDVKHPARLPTKIKKRSRVNAPITGRPDASLAHFPTLSHGKIDAIRLRESFSSLTLYTLSI
jgi:hypothetical protein